MFPPRSRFRRYSPPVIELNRHLGPGSSGTGTALSASTLTRTTGATTYPPTFDFTRPIDWTDGIQAAVQISTDPTFATGVTETVNTIYAATTTYNFGMSTITTGSVFWRMGAWSGTRPGSLIWSNICNVGDTVAPTISSATGTTWANGAPMLVTVTASESGYPTLTGTDASLLEMTGTIPASTIGVRLAGNANFNWNTKSSYSWGIYWTDYAGNVSSTLSRTETVSAPAAAQFTTTNGSSKSQYITVSGTPPLTAIANANTGSNNNVRVTFGVTGKRQFEVTVTSGTTQGFAIWVDDGSTVLGNAVYPQIGSATNPKGARFQFTMGGSVASASIQGNGAAAQTSVANGVIAVGDVISVEFDTVAQTVSFYRTRSGVTVQIGATLTGQTWITGNVFAGVMIANTGLQLDANFGGAAFARALSTGYSSYNA